MNNKHMLGNLRSCTVHVDSIKSLFEVTGIVAAYAATIPVTSNNDM